MDCTFAVKSKNFLPRLSPIPPTIDLAAIKSIREQRNANQNYNEVSPHTSQKGHHQKIYKQQMLERVWRKGNPLALLVGM